MELRAAVDRDPPRRGIGRRRETRHETEDDDEARNAEADRGPRARSLRARLPDRAAAATGAPRRPGAAAGAADRRARPGRRGVRGLPARVAVRLPDHHPGTGFHQGVGAAGRRHHVEPDARTARRSETPLRLRLDRLPRLRQGTPDHHHQTAGCSGGAGRAGDPLRPGTASGRPLQGDRRLRDHRLGRRPRRPRPHGTGRRHYRTDPRHGPQDAGGHAVDAR